MKMNKQKANEDKRVEVCMQILWCKKNHLFLGGLPYFDDLAGRDGIHLQLIAPVGTSSEHIKQALREGYREHDVVSYSVLLCPVEWFSSAQVAYNTYLAGKK